MKPSLVCWAVVAMMGLGAVAATPSDATSSAQIARPLAAISMLLDDLGRAIVEGDRAVAAATMRDGPFRDARLRALDNATSVPFDAYDIEVTTQFSGDVTSPRITSRYPGLEVVTHHVLERTRIGGVETRPFLEDSFYTFVREGGDGSDRYDGWRLAADDDLDDLGLQSAGHIWDGGPVEVVRGKRFAALSHADVGSEARAIVALADGVYADVQRFWPVAFDDRFVIIVPSSTAELGRILRSTFDLSKFVAFAAAGADRSDGWEPAAARIFVHLQRFRRHDDTFKRETMAHELIHAVTRTQAGPFTPVWVEEGLASLGSEGGTGLEGARGAPRTNDFPADDEFTVGPTSEIVKTYNRSQVAMSVLAERVGRDDMAAFYTALGEPRVATGSTTYHLDRAVASIGWSVEAWREAWLDRLS